MNRISVLCPSRLVLSRWSSCRELYVERAIRSVRWQSVAAAFDWEIVVAVDPGQAGQVSDRLGGARVVEAVTTGQSAAVNAAYRAATGDFVAVLEDDDVWHWRKIELQLRALRDRPAARFVSANQIEVDLESGAARLNDFATPSGWLMPRETWEAVGPFDESFHWHVDNEWLGRLNARRIPRVHLVEGSTRPRELFDTLTRRSAVRATEEPFPLILREVHRDAATARITRHAVSRQESQDEYSRVLETFGEVPW